MQQRMWRNLPTMAWTAQGAWRGPFATAFSHVHSKHCAMEIAVWLCCHSLIP